ncbi:hypothetical protein L2E82_05686 [Cichorium intybus]|uniref:Uncharacterized protein n=1 Tax=Cichorium intybus TaxID=13427 RepID=A0ACB9H932_CICIN|nr:hypothetical protein L2E82_05686 [Cichorium intybus]
MDNQVGESSSSHQLYPADGVYAPATPAKPGRSETMISEAWLRTPFDEAMFEDTLTNKSFSSWERNLGSTSQNFEMYNRRVSMEDVGIWNIPCRDLLALADANGSSLKLHNFISDLNALPPIEPDVIVEQSHEPDVEHSTIVESNRESEKGLSEQINLNETPQQPKQRRRKHRPKVIKERKQKTPKKPVTPKPDGSSTGKRKYVRRKPVEKPTKTTPVVETIDLTSDPETEKSCKRKINFDEVEQVTEVIVEKTQVIETCPITPSKTEVPKEGKQSYKKAKCRINFLQETHDKGVINVSSPNESNCSTSAERSKQEISSKIDGNQMLPESMEAYLSAFTNYNTGMQLPAIYNKKIIENHHTSITSVDSGGNFSVGQNVNKAPKGVGMQTSNNKKRTKVFTLVNGSASLGGMIDGTHQQFMYMEAQVSTATKKRAKKTSIVSSSNNGQISFRNRTGCHPNTIKAVIKQFERLNINGLMKEKDRVAVVPYLSGYSEQNENAIVPFQGHGSVVPYDGMFNPIRKRKTRPKVDLDDETSRVWRLLLEDINSQGVDGTDEDKAKWWEEERRVFRGRADSFIARMHLVQGDRRFSRWKGSVLDSVIGVFLTQNVSDHLSSSAFMSLVSRYPSKSKSRSEPVHEENSVVSVQEPLDEEETIMLGDSEKREVVYSNEVSKNSAYTVDLNESSECGVDDVISSQNSDNTSPSSVQSSIAQSQSQTTEEQVKDRCQPPVIGGYTSFVELLHMQGSTTNDGKTVLPKECASEESGLSAESASQTRVQTVKTVISQKADKTNENICEVQQVFDKVIEFNSGGHGSNQIVNKGNKGSSVIDKVRAGKKQVKVDWDKLRLQAEVKEKKERSPYTMDALDYEALMNADVNDIADAIKERGMNNVLAIRIKALLDRIVKDHGSVDLEWLRDVPPDKAKEYLLSFRGLGLKSVECVRLLTLHHLAFPVDTNVGRIAVRLGWVPLQPLPESLQLHLLELYPVLESIQKYLWPRLCKLDQRTLYELHYQMITFGKVFCTKSKPNCNACPMRGECRHFASAFASARLGLPAPEESVASLTENRSGQKLIGMPDQHHPNLPPPSEQFQQLSQVHNCNPVIEEPLTPGPIIEEPSTPGPIVEVPASPEPEQIQQIQQELDMEDFCEEDSEEIPMIKLNMEEFTHNLQTYMERHMELGEGDMSKALVALTSEAAAIPTPKLKNVSQLRTEHQVYELPDSHPLLEGLDTREPDDPCSYLLAIWTPGETADSIQPPSGQCSSQESGTLCNEETCFFCNSTREANSQTVRGTLLIPCRTAMRGSFPLNGTYFQVNEVFADHDSSLNPIDVPRSWLWNLPRRTVYFGTSIPTIFKGLTTEDIQYCFWRGFVCVRGFDQKSRAPRPLMARLHFPASKRAKTKTDAN